MKKNWEVADRDELIREIEGLTQKLCKKNEDLSRARFRLRKARVEVMRLKEIVAYQRTRIVELYV